MLLLVSLLIQFGYVPDVIAVVAFCEGVLACLDGYLNMALEQSEEYGVDGLLKAKYGDCFIRGNNGKSRGRNVGHFYTLVSAFLIANFSLPSIKYRSALCIDTKAAIVG